MVKKMYRRGYGENSMLKIYGKEWGMVRGVSAYGDEGMVRMYGEKKKRRMVYGEEGMMRKKK